MCHLLSMSESMIQLPLGPVAKDTSLDIVDMSTT